MEARSELYDPYGRFEHCQTLIRETDQRSVIWEPSYGTCSIIRQKVGRFVGQEPGVHVTHQLTYEAAYHAYFESELENTHEGLYCH